MRYDFGSDNTAGMAPEAVVPHYVRPLFEGLASPAA